MTSSFKPSREGLQQSTNPTYAVDLGYGYSPFSPYEMMMINSGTITPEQYNIMVAQHRLSQEQLAQQQAQAQATAFNTYQQQTLPGTMQLTQANIDKAGNQAKNDFRKNVADPAIASQETSSLAGGLGGGVNTFKAAENAALQSRANMDASEAASKGKADFISQSMALLGNVPGAPTPPSYNPINYGAYAPFNYGQQKGGSKLGLAASGLASLASGLAQSPGGIAGGLGQAVGGIFAAPGNFANGVKRGMGSQF